MDGQNFNNQQPVYQQPMGMEPQGDKPHGMSIAALVLGICGIVGGCCVPILGLVLGIIGVVLGVLGNKNSKTKLGTAGFVVSIVACGVSIAIWIISAVILSTTGNAFNQILNSYY